MRKDIKHLTLNSNGGNAKKPETILSDLTGIDSKKTFSVEDIENLEHLDFGAGIAPFLRGTNTTMHVQHLWEVKQYAALGTTAENNAVYQHFTTGQERPAIVFKPDTDNLTINTVEDLKALFEGIPLNEISVAVEANKSALAILAFYIVVAETQRIKPEQLSGFIISNVLTGIAATDAPAYTPALHTKIITDIVDYSSKKMPSFSICISGYQVHEAGATPAMELAYSLAEGMEYIHNGLQSGKKIDDLASQLSFSWGIGMNLFTEIAKMRAGRLLWAKLIKQFNPRDDKSMALHAHCKTSNKSLTKQDQFNNVARTCIEAMAAVFGGTNSLHTRLFDQMKTVPPDISTRIALNTQLYLQEETNISKTTDPWGGSYYVETLTDQIVHNAWDLLKEIEECGGMAKAVNTGIPKQRIEEAAIKKQTRLDSEEDIIVGATKYIYKKENLQQLPDTENKNINNQTGQQEIAIPERDNYKVSQSLAALDKAIRTGDGNLLELAIEAAKNRATLNEISNTIQNIHI